VVVVDLVVTAPQPLVRRHRHQQRTTRLDDPAHLAQRREIVLEVLDHV